MKKTLASLVLIATIAFVGCGHLVTASTPPPLPAGAVNQIDADANSLLQAAHAFASRITSAVQSTDPSVHIELTDVQKNLLIQLNIALNTADPLEQAYHNAPTVANQVALQNATPAVQVAFSNAAAAIPPAKQ